MSDNELDAELLALAGEDDSSDDEGVKAESGASRSRSRSRSPAEPADKPTENAPTASSPPKKPTSQHRSDKTMKATPRKARKDESEEEGEAYASRVAGFASSPRHLLTLLTQLILTNHPQITRLWRHV